MELTANAYPALKLFFFLWEMP